MSGQELPGITAEKTARKVSEICCADIAFGIFVVNEALQGRVRIFPDFEIPEFSPDFPGPLARSVWKECKVFVWFRGLSVRPWACLHHVKSRCRPFLPACRKCQLAGKNSAPEGVAQLVEQRTFNP